MPRSREVEQYTDQNLEFTEKTDLGTEVSVVCPNIKSAMSLRNQYYAFVGALKKKRYFLEAQPQALSSDQQRLVDIAQLAFKVICQVDQGEEGIKVKWTNRENSWQSKLLAQAIVGDQQLPPVTIEMPASLAALAEKAK